MHQDIEHFVGEYVKELEAGTAAVFAGAGLSASAGFVDWVTLLESTAKLLGLDARAEQDHLVALAQYHVNSSGMNRSALHRALLDNFPAHAAPSVNHVTLARLPVPVYWTTNYDRLIERALEDQRKIPDAKYTVAQLAHTKPHRDSVIFKMHGDVEHPDGAVLTKDDYERYAIDRGPFVTALSGDLVSRTFLFLGFSFKDPNLDYILSRIRINFQKNAREHYSIFRRVKREEYDSTERFQYAEVKQALATEDLKRFNIKSLFVDEYTEITDILRRIEARYRRKTVFISGSAEEFGQWDKVDVEEFLAGLGRILMGRGYRLVSGFGLGISNAILSGATEEVYEKRMGHFADFLTVRPFPRHTKDPSRRAELWTAFRKELISQAGVAIFLFGNKTLDGQVVPADGVREEYDLCRELGVVAIPIGATGYVASEIAEKEAKVSSGWSPAYRSSWEMLQRPTERPQELLSHITSFLDQIGVM